MLPVSRSSIWITELLFEEVAKLFENFAEMSPQWAWVEDYT